MMINSVGSLKLRTGDTTLQTMWNVVQLSQQPDSTILTFQCSNLFILLFFIPIWLYIFSFLHI